MGLTCSKARDHVHDLEVSTDVPDPEIYEFLKRSVLLTQSSSSQQQQQGLGHLLYKNQQLHQRGAAAAAAKKKLLLKESNSSSNNNNNNNNNGNNNNNNNNNTSTVNTTTTSIANPNDNKGDENALSSKNEKKHFPTRLLIRRHPVRSSEEGVSGTHIYAFRLADTVEQTIVQQEQCPVQKGEVEGEILEVSLESKANAPNTTITTITTTTTTNSNPSSSQTLSKQQLPLLLTDEQVQNISPDEIFTAERMGLPPKREVVSWVTVSEEHSIYVADVGLSALECEQIVAVTEQVCRGQYAAYTYAKQTLGCREFPALANVVQDPVHTVTHAILEFSKKQQQNNKKIYQEQKLALDDREPHMVKYDVTKKERQKLDMHTDKSEWTFLISLSNGSGMDYTGGGTYFECLDSTVHIQRGHALIFPGKLRHCGQRISTGLRFLLVGFLVDKATPTNTTTPTTTTTTTTAGKKKNENEDDYVNNIP